MLERSQLRDQFLSLLEQQQQAVALYARLAGAAQDESLREQAIQIHREKQRHIQLTERLLEIVN